MSYDLLKKHIDKFYDKKRKDWNNLPCDENFKSFLLDCLNKWDELFNNVFLRNEKFLKIAAPFTEHTLFNPCQYYMRFDGSIVFIENILLDDYGELIAGHPLRFPYIDSIPGWYYSNNIEPDIFGIPMKCTTRVFFNGRKDYQKQTEDCLKIINYQRNSKYPILPLYFHNQKVNDQNLRITQTPIFRRENFIVYFPVRRALDYMYNIIKFEPVVKGTEWLLSKSHTYPFSKFEALEYDSLGVTGSSSFGDTNDKEDFDVMFLDSLENLQKFRDFINEAVKNDLFTFVSKNRGLRVKLNEIKIECNNNQPLILCTFLNLNNIRDDILYRSRFNILGKIDYFEARVQDDSENMINPPRIKIADFRNVQNRDSLILEDNMLLIAMTGTARGLYYKDMYISVKDSIVVEFKPENADPFRAIVSIGWYDIEILN
ncbi:MAG: hypothetical protein AB1765_00010 [Candidatus Hydrogenedentota bacterium]